jgi:hypothetical protein
VDQQPDLLRHLHVKRNPVVLVELHRQWRHRVTRLSVESLVVVNYYCAS